MCSCARRNTITLAGLSRSRISSTQNDVFCTRLRENLCRRGRYTCGCKSVAGSRWGSLLAEWWDQDGGSGAVHCESVEDTEMHIQGAILRLALSYSLSSSSNFVLRFNAFHPVHVIQLRSLQNHLSTCLPFYLGRFTQLPIGSRHVSAPHYILLHYITFY